MYNVYYTVKSELLRVRPPLWQSSFKEKTSSSLTCTDSVLWGATVYETKRVRPQHPQEGLPAQFRLYVHTFIYVNNLVT